MKWFSPTIISLVIALVLLGMLNRCQPQSQETAAKHDASKLKTDTLAVKPAGQPKSPNDDREV
jgi:hypothetical protein